jgi:hypothetical protein
VLERSDFEIWMATEKLKRHKSPGTDQIPAEMIKAGGKSNHSEFHKLINCIGKKEELPEQWQELISLPIYKKGDCSNYKDISLYQLHTKFYPPSCYQD